MSFLKVITIIKIVLFVNLFNSTLAEDKQICGIGCICTKINQSYECQSCINGFEFNSEQKSCTCEEGLVGYQNFQTTPPKSECLAICPQNNKPNFQKRVCEVAQECSQTFYRKSQITNLKTAIGFGLYEEKYIVVLYDTFMNIISIASGNFEKQINYPSDVIIIRLIDGKIYMIQGINISVWDIERGEISIISLVTKGKANKNSYLIKLSDENLLYSTQDTNKQKIYINLIANNQIIQPQPIELDAFQIEIKIYNDNILAKVIQQNKLQLQLIQIQNQQIQLSNILTEDLFCLRENGDQINLLGSIEFLLKFENNSYLISFTLENSIFIIKQTQSKCLIAISNIKPLKIMIITKQTQQNNQIIIIQLQNQIKIYSQDFQLLQQMPISNNMNDFNIYQYLSNGKLYLKLYALQTKGKLDIFECQFENNVISFTKTSSLQLKINEPLKLLILNSTINYLQTQKQPVLYALNYHFTSIDIQTNAINYNVADLETNYTPHKSAITSLQLTKNLNILVTSSNDGIIVIWNLQDKQNAVVYYVFNEVQENCIFIQIFSDRYILAKYQSKIVIIDIYNPTTFKSIEIKNPSSSVYIQETSNYGIITSDGCLSFYDVNIELIFQSCDDKYNTLSSISPQKNNQFVIRLQNIIQILQIDFINKSITKSYEYSHNSKIGLYKVRQYKGSKLFSIIFVDGLLQFYCFNNQLQQKIKMQLNSTISTPLDFNFPLNSDQEDYFFIANTTDLGQSLKYQVYWLSESFQQPKFINSLQLLSNVFSIFVDKQPDGEDIFRIPLLMPFSVVTLIYQFSYSSISGRIESGVHPILLGEQLSRCQVKFDQYQWLGICGSTTGFVGFAQILKQNYYQVYKGNYQTAQPISTIRQSLPLERYFIVKGSILVYNFHTDEQEEEIIFQDTINPIKEIQLNENLKIITFIKDKEIFIRNYSNNNHFQGTVGFLSGILLDDVYQRIVAYGDNINIYLPSQQNSKQQILTTSIAIKCIFTKSLMICKFNPSLIILYDRKTLSQGITITVSNLQPVNFNFIVDESNGLLYIYYIQIYIYDLTGQLIKTLLQPTQVLIEFNFYGNKIVLSDNLCKILTLFAEL